MNNARNDNIVAMNEPLNFFNEIEQVVSFETGNYLHVRVCSEGYIDFTATTPTFDEIDGGQYGCDVTSIVDVEGAVSAVLDFMGWNWGKFFITDFSIDDIS